MSNDMAIGIAVVSAAVASVSLIVGEVPARWPGSGVSRNDQPNLYWGIIAGLFAASIACALIALVQR